MLLDQKSRSGQNGANEANETNNGGHGRRADHGPKVLRPQRVKDSVRPEIVPLAIGQPLTGQDRALGASVQTEVVPTKRGANAQVQTVAVIVADAHNVAEASLAVASKPATKGEGVATRGVAGAKSNFPKWSSVPAPSLKWSSRLLRPWKPVKKPCAASQT